MLEKVTRAMQDCQHELQITPPRVFASLTVSSDAKVELCFVYVVTTATVPPLSLPLVTHVLHTDLGVRLTYFRMAMARCD
jgi:hypothetical protein